MNQTIEQLDIYNKTGLYEKELKLLEKSGISQRNIDLITDFHNHLFSTESKEQRVSKLSGQLRYICRWLKALEVDRNLDKLNQNDLTKLVSHINRMKERSEETRADYRRCIKQFYKWYKDNDQRLFSENNEVRISAIKLYRFIEKQIKRGSKLSKADPNTVLTAEDIDLIVEKGATTPRDKAFISLLHETGCRIGEFLNLRVGNITNKGDLFELYIPFGKTGPRVVFVRKAIPHLIKYLDVHPFKNNNNSYLWLKEAMHTKKEPLLYIGGVKLIRRCFERVQEVKKKHNPHWFRHSRATILAPNLTEAILCQYMGWTLGSDEVKRYVHLCKKHLEDEFLNIHGLRKQENVEMEPIKCICETLNDPKERYCMKCHRPLKLESAIQDKEIVDTEIAKTMKLFMEVAKNPEMMEAFEQFKKQMSKKT